MTFHFREWEGKKGLADVTRFHLPKQWRAAYYWYPLIEELVRRDKVSVVREFFPDYQTLIEYLNDSMITWALIERVPPVLTTERSSGKMVCDLVGLPDYFFRFNGVLIELNSKTRGERLTKYVDWMSKLSTEDIRKIVGKYLHTDINNSLDLLDKLFDDNIIADLCAFESLSAIFREIGRGDIVNNIVLLPNGQVPNSIIEPSETNTHRMAEQISAQQNEKFDEFTIRDIRVTKYPFHFTEEKGEGNISCRSCKISWPSARFLPCDHWYICRTCVLAKIGTGIVICSICQEKIEEVRRNYNCFGTNSAINKNQKKEIMK